MTAGRQRAIEQVEVAHAAMRRQMVEAAGIVDQVVRPAKAVRPAEIVRVATVFRVAEVRAATVVRAGEAVRDEGEGVAAAEADLGTRLAGSILGPGDG